MSEYYSKCSSFERDVYNKFGDTSTTAYIVTARMFMLIAIIPFAALAYGVKCIANQGVKK